jgi:mRNA-degrading endonuclease toxin of MazEF toxin-antitoxin module
VFSRLAAAPGNVALAEGTAGLDRDCVVDIAQVLTLDKSTLDEVDFGLRLALGL